MTLARRRRSQCQMPPWLGILRRSPSSTRHVRPARRRDCGPGLRRRLAQGGHRRRGGAQVVRGARLLLFCPSLLRHHVSGIHPPHQVCPQPGRQAEGREAAAPGRRGVLPARRGPAGAAPPRGPGLRGEHPAAARHLGAGVQAPPQGERACKTSARPDTSLTPLLTSWRRAPHTQVNPAECSLLVTEALFNLPALMVRGRPARTPSPAQGGNLSAHRPMFAPRPGLF